MKPIPQTKSKNKNEAEQSDRDQTSSYIPCHHDGAWDKNSNCDCYGSGRSCEKFCHCRNHCEKRFPGCGWIGFCDVKTCLCIKNNRECDPEICTSCNSHIQQEALKLKSKHLPKSTNLCQNVDIYNMRQRRLFVGKSKVCPSLGLFAGEVIEPNEYIWIYSGEILNESDSENKGVIQDIIEETYLFTLNTEQVVDASKTGNIMRYSNHGLNQHCNAVPKIIKFVNGNQAIGLYATKHIDIGQEILFDYNIRKNFSWLNMYTSKYIKSLDYKSK